MKKKLLLSTPSWMEEWKRSVFVCFLAIICSFSTVMNVEAANITQSKGITVQMNNASITEVLKAIQKKTEFDFFYKNEQIPQNKKININLKDASINRILDHLFKNTKLSYKIIDHDIVITSIKKEQKNGNRERTVTGKVVDHTGIALPGVTIVIEGTTHGVISDINGSYAIEVGSGDNNLSFSFIGMKSKTISIKGLSSVNVEMEEDAINLSEVVAIGYGTQKKTEITSSISNISNEDFNKGFASNAMQALEGKVAGLQIIRASGTDPNSAPQIKLRGITSINGSSDPLIVVDGIPGGDLNSIAPEDIESFDVLRDGSAAAIYGTRGTNGVILITTKRGVAGKMNVEYSGYLSTEQITKYPDMLTPAEYRAFADYRGVAIEDGGVDTDWFEPLTRTPISQVHNLSFSGGTPQTQYRASINYRDNEGIVIGTGKEFFNGRMNVTHSGFDDKLKVQLNLSSTISESSFTDYGAFEMAARLNPTQPIYNEEGSFYQPTGYGEINPLSMLEHVNRGEKSKTSTGSAKATLEIIKGLTISGFGAFDVRDKNGYFHESKESKGSIKDGYNGKAKRDAFFEYHKIFESTIEYKKMIANHSFNLLGGYSYQDNVYENFFAENSDFTTDAISYNNLGSGKYLTKEVKDGVASLGSGKSSDKLISFFGRFQYGYLGKYLLSASVRREGSTKFGEDNKWGIFPAVSVGWRITEEAFMDNIEFLDDLKLRAGYGVTGNDGISPYQSISKYGAGDKYILGKEYYTTWGASSNPNKDLKWETKTEINLGLDFQLLNGRLSGSVDVYNRKTKDLLYRITAQVPSYIHDNVLANLGEISNQGVELSLNATAIKTKDLKWNLSANFSKNKNELVSLSNNVYQFNAINYGGLPSPGNLGEAYRMEEGVAIGSFYGKVFEGFTPDGKWIFKEIDGKEGIAEGDKEFIGNGNPEYFANLTSTLNYKNFDLTLSFRGAFGFDILNLKEMYYGNPKWFPNNVLTSALNSPINDDPQYSDYFLEKGDYIKFDNLTLGYTLNKNTIKWAKSIRFYGSVLNIATITGYSGLDPELSAGGSQAGWDGRGFYPRTTTYTFGVNVKF